MDESILTSIKELLGIQDEYTHFDNDLIIHINSVLAIVNQLGIGPEAGVSISDKSTKWSAVLETSTNLQLVITYVFIRVKQIFDPPATGPLAEALNKQAEEYSWRLSVAIPPISEPII